MKQINSTSSVAGEEVGVCLTYFREQTLLRALHTNCVQMGAANCKHTFEPSQIRKLFINGPFRTPASLSAASIAVLWQHMNTSSFSPDASPSASSREVAPGDSMRPETVFHSLLP